MSRLLQLSLAMLAFLCVVCATHGLPLHSRLGLGDSSAAVSEPVAQLRQQAWHYSTSAAELAAAPRKKAPAPQPKKKAPSAPPKKTPPKGTKGKTSRPVPYTRVLEFESQKKQRQQQAQKATPQKATNGKSTTQQASSGPAFTGLKAAVAAALTAAGITDANERAMFFGQAHVETQGFEKLRETGYSAANVWKARGNILKQFKVTQKQVENDFRKYGSDYMFNYMYDDRYRTKANRLGNTSPGDGSKYFGRGVLQLTGRANYAKAAQALNDPTILSNPGQLLNQATAIKVSVDYWKSRSSLRSAAKAGNVQAVSVAVNGNSPNHLKERGEWYRKYLKDTRVTRT